MKFKRLHWLLVEAVKGELYHATHLGSATRIIKNGFILSTHIGTGSEIDLAEPDTYYYLSLTTNKKGRFHAKYPEDLGILFNIDGPKISKDYAGKPVDYWQAGPEMFEDEYRIFSKEQVIPSKYIKSIHVNGDASKAVDRKWQSYVIDLMLAAKKARIPLYFYSTDDDWLDQKNPIKMNIKQLKHHVDSVFKSDAYTGMVRRDYLKGYKELYYKNTFKQLSKGAKEILRNNQVEARSTLMNNIHNMKNDPEVTKIVDIFKKEGYKSVNDFVEAIFEKWDVIKKVEQYVEALTINNKKQLSNDASMVVYRLSDDAVRGMGDTDYQKNMMIKELEPLLKHKSPEIKKLKQAMNKYKLKSAKDVVFYLTNKWHIRPLLNVFDK